MLHQLAHCQYLAGRPIVRDSNFDYHDRFLSAVFGMRPPKLDISLHEQGSRFANITVKCGCRPSLTVIFARRQDVRREQDGDPARANAVWSGG
jgi:hypothetical protein